MGNKEKNFGWVGESLNSLKEKIEKVPCGNSLLSIFNKFTSGEIHIVPGNQNETKAIAPLSSFDSAAMELSHLENPKESLLTLAVFRSKDYSPDIRFIITVFKEEDKVNIKFADFKAKKENYELLNPYYPYDQQLVDILIETVRSLKVEVNKGQYSFTFSKYQ